MLWMLFFGCVFIPFHHSFFPRRCNSSLDSGCKSLVLVFCSSAMFLPCVLFASSSPGSLGMGAGEKRIAAHSENDKHWILMEAPVPRKRQKQQSLITASHHARQEKAVWLQVFLNRTITSSSLTLYWSPTSLIQGGGKNTLIWPNRSWTDGNEVFWLGPLRRRLVRVKDIYHL